VGVSIWPKITNVKDWDAVV